MSYENHALTARVEVGLYRILNDVDQLKAFAHLDRAHAAAAAAYDAGQHLSPLLVDEKGLERDLVLEARLARERATPLRTNFVQWIRPLTTEGANDLSTLATRFDAMSLADWCEAGDRATVIDSAFQLPPHTRCAKAFGSAWSQTQENIRQGTVAFLKAAEGRAELSEVNGFMRGYLKDGLGVAIYALGDTALGIEGPDSYWLSRFTCAEGERAESAQQATTNAEADVLRSSSMSLVASEELGLLRELAVAVAGQGDAAAKLAQLKKYHQHQV